MLSVHSRCGLHTCAVTNSRHANRRLQPLRYLHDCSDCFRLERLPGGACTHWKAPPLHGARQKRPIAIGCYGRLLFTQIRTSLTPRATSALCELQTSSHRECNFQTSPSLRQSKRTFPFCCTIICSMIRPPSPFRVGSCATGPPVSIQRRRNRPSAFYLEW